MNLKNKIYKKVIKYLSGIKPFPTNFGAVKLAWIFTIENR
jgi:hypothetical protein